MGGFMDEDLASDAQLKRQGRHPEPPRLCLVDSVGTPPWWGRQANLKAMALQRCAQLLKICGKCLEVHGSFSLNETIATRLGCSRTTVRRLLLT